MEERNVIGEEGEDSDDSESVATEGDTIAESEHLTDADTKSEAGLSEAGPRTPEPDIILEPSPAEPEPEPEPPSPAPEELWEYLKEVVTSNAVVTVDALVEKLVTTVSSIPQPLLKSVVKESIKKQKSVEEEESHLDDPPPENSESGEPAVDGSAPPPVEETEDQPPAEGQPAAEVQETAEVVNPPAESQPSEQPAEVPTETPVEVTPSEALSEQPVQIETAA